MSAIIHISFAKFYKFEGWVFDYSRSKPFPPHPCKKDLEPRKRVGKVFWDMFSRFSKLSVDEQENYRYYD